MLADSPLIERFVIAFDIEKYSRHNTRRQAYAQADLRALLDLAAKTVGLDRATWEPHHTGDGEIAVLPPDVDMVRVVRNLTHELNTRLLTYNEDRAADAAMRLRVAMHTDAFMRTESGYAGDALVVLTRLLNAQPLRVALAEGDRAALALMVSDPVFKKVGRSGLGGIRPEHFKAVSIDIPEKNFQHIGHLHVPGYDMDEFGPPPPGEPQHPGALAQPSSSPTADGKATGGARYHIRAGRSVTFNKAGRDINVERQG
jgi:hypothetical protein